MIDVEMLHEAMTVLDGLDGDPKEAWMLVKEASWLAAGSLPPPTPMGAAWHEAHSLADQLAKIGLVGGWETPPKHSEAMERLIHRLTTVLETFLDFYEQAGEMRRGMMGELLLERPLGEVVWDEAFQPAYCDYCGEQLMPDGLCPDCDSKDLT